MPGGGGGEGGGAGGGVGIRCTEKARGGAAFIRILA